MDWIRKKYWKKSLRYSWPWKSVVKVTLNFFMFYTYSAHQTTYKNLLKTRLILEMKFDLEIEIFKIKGVCGNVFHIQGVKLHKNILSNLHDKWEHFFYIALNVDYAAGRYIDQLSRGLYLRYAVILCINFAFSKRSICTEIFLQLKV